MPAKIFSDFSGGWSGTLDPAKVPPTMYDARNLIVYQDGSLGPRPGLRAFNLGRTTGGKITGSFYSAHDVHQLLYIDGTHVWSVKADNLGTSPTDFGAMNGPPAADLEQSFFGNDPQTAWVSGLAYPTRNLYQINLVTPGLTAVDPGNGSFVGVIYGTRIVHENGLQIKWSYPLNFFGWPAANFLSIGARGEFVVFIADHRNHLSIATMDGQWWVLTGVPGVNDTLRRVADPKVVPPLMSPRSFVDLGDDLIYYLSPVNNFPATFDGANVVEYPYLSMTPEDPRASYASSLDFYTAFNKVMAIQGATNDSPAFILPDPTNRLLTKHHGAWSLHEFAVPIGQTWASDGRGRMFGFGPLQAAANTPSFTMDWRLNRPAFTSDTFARPGDLSDTPFNAYLTLAEQWSESGDLQHVREVIVDFTRWNTGVANNNITATVTSLARGSELADASEVKTWTQAGSSSPSTQAGQRDRVRFTFGEQGAGAGYRVSLSGLVGVAIRQVIVVTDDEETNGRAW